MRTATPVWLEPTDVPARSFPFHPIAEYLATVDPAIPHKGFWPM
jgi:hypothetical protein